MGSIVGELDSIQPSIHPSTHLEHHSPCGGVMFGALMANSISNQLSAMESNGELQIDEGYWSTPPCNIEGIE